MSTALIVINQSGKSAGIPGVSRDDLSVGYVVTLTNNNNTDVTTWLWEFISKPSTSSATINNSTTSASTFTPDVVGSYLIQLTVNGTIVNQKIAAVKTDYLRVRIPAALESTQFVNWATTIHSAFLNIDSYASYSLYKDGRTVPTANINWGGYRITNLGTPSSAMDAANMSYVDGVKAALDGYLSKSGLNSPTANISWDGYKITNLGTPISLNDAATKDYVDSNSILPSLLDSYLSLSGTNVPTANISWGGYRLTSLGTPLSATDAANKAYVDVVKSALDGYLSKSGLNSPTANINWGGYRITNLGVPSVSADAATKGYVDSYGFSSALFDSYLALSGTNSPTANINWGGYRITNLGTPTVSADAATKGYVDSYGFSSALFDSYLALSGTNSPTANISWDGYRLTNLGAPTTSTDAATRLYVDGYLSKSGTNSPTANINWGGYKITNHGTPTVSTDVATKGYVDGYMGGGFASHEEEFTAVGGTETFTLSSTPASNANMLSGRTILGVYRNGQRCRWVSTSTSALEWNLPASNQVRIASLTIGDIIIVIYGV